MRVMIIKMHSFEMGPFLKIGIDVNTRVNGRSRSENVRVEAINSNCIIATLKHPRYYMTIIHVNDGDRCFLRLRLPNFVYLSSTAFFCDNDTPLVICRDWTSFLTLVVITYSHLSTVNKTQMADWRYENTDLF